MQREGPREKGNKDGGLFTGRLKGWQVLLAVALVAYLVYGKYQDTKPAEPVIPPGPTATPP